MKLYLVVTVDNDYVAVVPADSKNEARMKVARETREGLAFLCAERLVDDIYKFPRK